MRTVCKWRWLLLLCCLCVPLATLDAKRKVRRKKTFRQKVERVYHGYQRHVIPEDVEKGTHGVDLSHYQGYINWDYVVNDTRIGFVYLKATEGATIKDRHYAANLKAVRAKYVPVGSYHFFVPRVSPYAQYRNFISTAIRSKQDLLPVVDIETLGTASPSVCRQRLRVLLRLLTNHYGKRPMIYSSYRFYRYVLKGRITGYKFFIAYYKKGVPAVGKGFTLWQYTDRARFKGVNHPVDLNKFAEGHTLEDILLRPLPKRTNQKQFRSYEKVQRIMAPFSVWLRRPFVYDAQRKIYRRSYSIYR